MVRRIRYSKLHQTSTTAISTHHKEVYPTSPHPFTPPTYGAKQQHTYPISRIELDPKDKQ